MRSVSAVSGCGSRGFLEHEAAAAVSEMIKKNPRCTDYTASKCFDNQLITGLYLKEVINQASEEYDERCQCNPQIIDGECLWWDRIQIGIKLEEDN